MDPDIHSSTEDGEAPEFCLRQDRKDTGITVLSLPDDNLSDAEGVVHDFTVWRTILDVFVGHILLNGPTSECTFYTVLISEYEATLIFAKRIRHLSVTITSIHVDSDKKEMTIFAFNDVPDHDEHLSRARDGLRYNYSSLSIDR